MLIDVPNQQKRHLPVYISCNRGKDVNSITPLKKSIILLHNHYVQNHYSESNMYSIMLSSSALFAEMRHPMNAFWGMIVISGR